MNYKDILYKIDKSFRDCTKGEEDIKVVIKFWGALPYLFFYFIVDNLILKIDSRFTDMFLASTSSIYFIWHIYVLVKCSPKKPILTKEEKKKIRQEKLKNAPKAFFKKFLLQEPMSKWNPVKISIVIDLLFLVTFASYIF